MTPDNSAALPGQDKIIVACGHSLAWNDLRPRGKGAEHCVAGGRPRLVRHAALDEKERGPVLWRAGLDRRGRWRIGVRGAFFSPTPLPLVAASGRKDPQERPPRDGPKISPLQPGPRSGPGGTSSPCGGEGPGRRGTDTRLGTSPRTRNAALQQRLYGTPGRRCPEGEQQTGAPI
ncbi:hypothetical protein NDU88_010034 [Pleurodeles waltl]|uniref:Uncharacterized protein n=1 Tax=Pleurodeles waltl TaxID=8319 RepID=A0AAV7PUK9_PLEWA|nr:hypothetical protein NDU88_010034 [Pleurodeles waltl]